MNIQEYISSGIVESYVLGLASNEERLEFEQLCAAHAELRQAREAFEISLEQHALANAVAPPAALKQKIWKDIDLATVATTSVSSSAAGAAIQPLAPVRSMGGFVKFMAAASVILLVAAQSSTFIFTINTNLLQQN